MCFYIKERKVAMSTSQSKKEIITIIGEWLWKVIGRILLNGIVLSPFYC